jgi:hypothetical protein
VKQARQQGRFSVTMQIFVDILFRLRYYSGMEGGVSPFRISINQEPIRRAKLASSR